MCCVEMAEYRRRAEYNPFQRAVAGHRHCPGALSPLIRARLRRSDQCPGSEYKKECDAIDLWFGKNHTKIVIAHRLNTVKQADKIITLERVNKAGKNIKRWKKKNPVFQSIALS